MYARFPFFYYELYQFHSDFLRSLKPCIKDDIRLTVSKMND